MAQPRVIDYEGSPYSSEFWNPMREYEDRAERIALRALLPPRGRRLVDVGAGAGRLGALYAGYDQVILMDYARSTLVEARQRWGGDARFRFVAADVYRLPFADGALDVAVMVRVMHHLADVPRALANLAAAIRPGGALVVEFANKRHLKSMLRYGLRRQAWSPYDRDPIELVELNFDFHPAWMRERIRAAGFVIERQRTVSMLRVAALKRRIAARVLASIDGALQRPLAPLAIGPSQFVRCRLRSSGPAAAGLFKCPECGATDWVEAPAALICANRHSWSTADGIYDFRVARPEA